MLLSILQKILVNDLLENVDLKGTLVEVVFPTSIKNVFSRKKVRLRNIFKEIERKIRKRADPTYEEIAKFREIGGYLLIKEGGI